MNRQRQRLSAQPAFRVSAVRWLQPEFRDGEFGSDAPTELRNRTSRMLSSRQVTRHSVPSNLSRNLLKTNKGDTNYSTHFFEGPYRALPPWAVIHFAKVRPKGGLLRYKLSAILTLCTILLAAGTASAHHSPSSIFNMAEKFTLTGTLTQVDWVNPHIAIYMDVKKPDGSGVVNWKFESAPPSWLKRVGVNSADFKQAIGQSVTVEGNRARDGSPYGFLQKITFADGNSLAMVSPSDINTTK